MYEEVTLTRDCAATMVPWGSPDLLRRGDLAHITQQLGGSFTVMVHGNLYRIEGRDADALGKTALAPAGEAVKGEANRESVEQAAWEQLASCYDPEIPINIVELGLVYDLRVTPLADGKSFRVEVEMTLTAPGCGMGNFLSQEVRDKLLTIPGVTEADVRLVWEPPWSREMMSEAARLEAGMY